uniref:helix-turn-helix domain-containing protein n=1 Tax=Agathobacter sp. TaxID=2021311 RepID=UPI004056E36B
MERLKLLRKENKLTQQKLADILHVSQQSIHKYEHGITTPDLETLKNMARRFNTSTDYLLDMTDVPHKIEPVTGTMLNDEELDFIESYRKIGLAQKELVRAIVQEFLGKNHE